VHIISLYAREKAIIQDFWLEKIHSLEIFASIFGSVATVVDVR
jgi:hypothetical protein